MATYEVTAPDGSVHEVTAPDTASDADVLAYARQQFASGYGAAPAAASQADVRASEPAGLGTFGYEHPTLSKILQTAAPLVRGLIAGGPTGLMAAGGKGALEGLDTAAKWVGGTGTDLAMKAGASPELAAGIGTLADLGVQAPLLFVPGGGAKAVAGAARELAPAAEAVAQNAGRWATDAGKFVVPGEQGTIANLLENLPVVGAGKTVSNQAASRVNQDLVQRLVARDLGLPEDQQITEAALAALRKEKGAAYDAVKSIPGNIEADDAYRQALQELQNGLQYSSFPDAELGQAAQKAVTNANVESMAPKDMVEYAKNLRASAGKLSKSFDDPEKITLARTQRAIADNLEGLIDRSTPDSPLMANYRAARQTIAKAHNVSDALNDATGEINARKLGDNLSGGLAQASQFAQANPKLVQMPSTLGPDYWSGNLLGSGLPAAAGLAADVLGGGMGLFTAGGALARPAAIKVLKGIYTRAAAAGDTNVALHASRLSALLQSVKAGVMSPAAQALARESAEVLQRANYIQTGRDFANDPAGTLSNPGNYLGAAFYGGRFIPSKRALAAARAAKNSEFNSFVEKAAEKPRQVTGSGTLNDPLRWNGPASATSPNPRAPKVSEPGRGMLTQDLGGVQAAEAKAAKADTTRGKAPKEKGRKGDEPVRDHEQETRDWLDEHLNPETEVNPGEAVKNLLQLLKRKGY